MPIRKPDNVTEHRLTLGKVERQALEEMKWVGVATALAPIGAGLALAGGIIVGMGIFVKGGIDFLQDTGASEETRIEVNEAVANGTSEEAYTPTQFSGMSPAAIYDLGHDVQEEMGRASYLAWLAENDAEDVGLNWAQWLNENGQAYPWGGNQVKVQNIRVDATGPPGVNAEGEQNYSALSYQMSIREIAARRRALQMGGGIGWAANGLGSLVNPNGWNSPRVSEAPGYVSDPLLWCAWARVDFPSGTSTMAGADMPVGVSYYTLHVQRSLGWEQALFDEHTSFMQNPQAWATGSTSRSWWPSSQPTA